MTATAEGRLGRRLRRILLILPYAIRHPGVTVDELSRKFDVKKKDLLDDLELLFLCGLPGYGPGDLIDVTVDGDRIFIRMADYFSAPLRLTPAEGLNLYAGAAALSQLSGMEGAEALKRATVKLGRALGLSPEEAQAPVELKVTTGPSTHVETLQRALAQHKRVRLEYLSASRAEMSERDVDPWGLIVTLGHTYLVGLDHKSEDERTFRTDRIKSAVMLEEDAPVPDDFDPEQYERAFVERGEEPLIELEISPQAARWFADYYPVREMAERDDGWASIVLPASSDSWAATLLLRLGSNARNVKPKGVEEKARELAVAIATQHRDRR